MLCLTPIKKLSNELMDHLAEEFETSDPEDIQKLSQKLENIIKDDRKAKVRTFNLNHLLMIFSSSRNIL